jgi:hypothetical protein
MLSMCRKQECDRRTTSPGALKQLPAFSLVRGFGDDGTRNRCAQNGGSRQCGNSVAIPAIAKTKKYEPISEGFVAGRPGFEPRLTESEEGRRPYALLERSITPDLKTASRDPAAVRAPHQAFGVSGCRRCVRRRANARKYRDNSGDIKIENTQRYREVLWLGDLDSNQD